MDEVLDQELLKELRVLTSKVDPVPLPVVEAAQAAFANREAVEE